MSRATIQLLEDQSVLYELPAGHILNATNHVSRRYFALDSNSRAIVDRTSRKRICSASGVIGMTVYADNTEDMLRVIKREHDKRMYRARKRKREPGDFQKISTVPSQELILDDMIARLWDARQEFPWRNTAERTIVNFLAFLFNDVNSPIAQYGGTELHRTTQDILKTLQKQQRVQARQWARLKRAMRNNIEHLEKTSYYMARLYERLYYYLMLYHKKESIKKLQTKRKLGEIKTLMGNICLDMLYAREQDGWAMQDRKTWHKLVFWILVSRTQEEPLRIYHKSE